MNRPYTDPEVPWLHAKDFVCKDSGMCVRVNKRELPQRFPGSIPMIQFSWELIRIKDDKRASRYFAILFEVELNIVNVEPFDTRRLRELLDDAEKWARDQRQNREDLVAQRR